MKHIFWVLIILISINVKSYSQEYFDTKLKFGQAKDENGKEMLQPYSLQPIEYSKIEELFKKFQNDGWIEFRYPQNGCQYRAHSMARILLENGIKSNKIWSFKPALLGENTSDELNIIDPNFPDEKIKWAYHVAPIVVVKMPNNQIDTLVIDPSIFNKPINYNIWLSSLNCSKQYYTFIHSKYIQYETKKNNILSGKWYSENYSLNMRWVSTSICKGKIFYMYIQNELLPINKRMNELDIAISTANSQKQKNGLLLEKKQLNKIYTKRKNIATNSDKFGELPGEYQSMLIECQEYFMECTYFYWDSIEKNQVLNKCKY